VNFETIACPACGSNYSQLFHDVLPGKLFSIVRRAHCRLLFTDPRPEPVGIEPSGAKRVAGDFSELRGAFRVRSAGHPYEIGSLR